MKQHVKAIPIPMYNRGVLVFIGSLEQQILYTMRIKKED
jgi:hypothetical protein